MPARPPLIVPLIATLALLAWGLAPSGVASGTSMRVREALRCDLRSKADYERAERGYYEQLLDCGRQLGALGEIPHAVARQGLPRASDAPFEAGALALPVADLREFVLKPGLATRHLGATWTTNALGMRDLPYETVKPPHTFRIALVGDSIAAGWGVDDGRGFEPTLERVLDVRARAAGGPTVEVLNFAVPGHSPGARWDHFTRLGWPTDPDLVIFEATQADVGWDERRLRGLLPRGVGWDSPLYRAALAAAGVAPGASAETYKRALRPFRGKILAGVYRVIAADCRSRAVPCVWVLIPRVGKAPEPAERARILAWARAAGFTAVADLSDAYDGLDPGALAIRPGDYHPNTDGHARLARRLDEVLSQRPEARQLWTADVSAENSPRREPFPHKGRRERVRNILDPACVRERATPDAERGQKSSTSSGGVPR